MSLAVFDSLRSRHPDRIADIGRLEEVIARLVRKNPEARLVDRSIANKSGLVLADVELFLVELCVVSLLEARVFWNCPNGKGVSEEAKAVSELPPELECPQCGQIHYLNAEDLELDFIPTRPLIDAIETAER